MSLSLHDVFDKIGQLAQYKIINYIKTGDNLVDTTLTALAMAGITASTNYMASNIKPIKDRLFKRLRGQTIEVTDTSEQIPQQDSDSYLVKNPEKFPRKDLEDMQLRVKVRSVSRINQIVEWMAQHYNLTSASRLGMAVTLDAFADFGKAYESSVAKSYTRIRMFPCYRHQEDYLYAHYDDDNYGGFHLACNEPATMKGFLAVLQEAFPATDPADGDTPADSTKKTPTRTCKVYDMYDFYKNGFDADFKPVNQYKTFDKMVFRGQEDFIQLIQDFEKNLNDKENIYVCKNLGILMHGSFGLGKTMLGKAMCNFLGRDAVTVDLTKKKSKKEFIKAFNKAVENNMIIIMDEFDHLIDTMTHQNSLHNKVDTEQEIAKIQRQITSFAGPKGDENVDIVKQLRSKLTDLLKLTVSKDDEPMDMGTFLPLLDGISETEGRVILATTNNPQNLQEHGALIRPGRFGNILHFQRYSSTEVQLLLTKIFKPDLEEAEYLKQQAFPLDLWSPIELITVSQTKRNLRDTVEHLQTKRPACETFETVCGEMSEDRQRRKKQKTSNQQADADADAHQKESDETFKYKKTVVYESQQTLHRPVDDSTCDGSMYHQNMSNCKKLMDSPSSSDDSSTSSSDCEDVAAQVSTESGSDCETGSDSESEED